jgi:hypothetical protein
VPEKSPAVNKAAQNPAQSAQAPELADLARRLAALPPDVRAALLKQTGRDHEA